MGFLKGLALSLLSVLLFLSVLLLGAGITLKLTVLNPHFINKQIQKLDLASLINETASDNPSANEMPEAIRKFLDTDLAKYSDELKAATEEANSRLYDYVLGRTKNLDLKTALGETVLAPQLIYSLTDKIDWPSFTDELIRKEINKQGGVDPSFSYLLDYIDDALVKLDPWFKSTLRQVVPQIHDYLLGQTQTLDVSISLEEPTNVLYSTLFDVFYRFPPPELAGFSASQKQLEFNNFFYFQVVPSLPAVIDLDSSFFSGAPQDLNQAFSDLKTGIDRIKSHVSKYWLAFFGLILVTVLLFALAFLILRRLAKLLLLGGVILFILGLIGFVASMVANSEIAGIDLGSVPTAVQIWLPGVIQSILRPFLWFSLGAGILGTVGIVISITMNPHPAQTRGLQLKP
jgi:hypothetical protein